MRDTEKMLEQVVAWYRPAPLLKTEDGDGTMPAEEISCEVDETPHRFWAYLPGTQYRTSDSYIDEWVKAGRPYEWTKVEGVKVNDVEFEGWIDFGRGRMALFEDGKLQGIGDNEVVGDRCVMIDMNYYGSKFYLWPRLV